MIARLKKSISRHISSIPGWRTRRKIVVIESDDWGSIRMPSAKVYKQLERQGIPVGQLPYQRFDSLENESDLQKLFQVLSKHKDSAGNFPMMTANIVVGNPDFDRIRRCDYKDYHFETFLETYRRYGYDGAFGTLKEGISSKLVVPQFHGREHLNVSRWMRALRENIGYTRLAFDNQMFDVSTGEQITESSFMESFNLESLSEIELHEQLLEEGLNLFEAIFGYRSRTFIAPCYVWSRRLHKAMKELGISGLQGAIVQKEPLPGVDHRFKKIRNYTGKLSSEGIVYLVRNVLFEPTLYPLDPVGNALAQMEIAFFWGKPAVITSHRLNYIGSLDANNRENGLRLLNEFIRRMLIKWPDVEFMSSDRLVTEIVNDLGVR